MGDQNQEVIKDLLTAVADGKITPEKALDQLKGFPYQRLRSLTVDTHRVLRKGLPEVIYGENKPLHTLKKLVALHQERDEPLVISRLDQKKARALLKLLPDGTYDPVSRLFYWKNFHPPWEAKGAIAIVSAGAADASVAEEVVGVLTFLNQPYERILDVGIAGLHRFLDHWDVLMNAVVIVAIAGMEGALPGVLAGLFPAPVIGVPTSQGYGTHLGGLAPLFTMLNSCAPGLAVVNIDNGVQAGYIATLMNKK